MEKWQTKKETTATQGKSTSTTQKGSQTSNSGVKTAFEIGAVVGIVLAAGLGEAALLWKRLGQ